MSREVPVRQHMRRKKSGGMTSVVHHSRSLDDVSREQELSRWRSRNKDTGAYSRIWRESKSVSKGFGFWGHSIMEGPHAWDALRAWVDGLQELGYPDNDIVFYGDWTDGRHIADNMKGTYAQMKAHVKENARPLDYVHKENEKYRATYAHGDSIS